MQLRKEEEIMTYEEWLDELVAEFVNASDMSPEEARDYVNQCDFEEFYSMGMTPEEMVIEDMGYWRD